MTEQPGTAAPPRDRLLLAVGSAAVLVLSAAVRMYHASAAFAGDRLLALDGDSLYHQRCMARIAETLRVQSFDPLMSWPTGAHHHWAPGFDVMGAALLLAGGGPNSFAGPVLAAALPVLLGLAFVAAAVYVAWLAAPVGVLRVPAALAAGVIAALIPQGVSMSRFARTDHHVLEALILASLAAWSLHRIDARERTGLAFEAGAAALAAGGVLSFTGAPLYLAVALAPLCLAALFSRSPWRLWGSGAGGLMAGAAVAAAASTPLVAEHGRTFSFVYPSLLQPALVALAGAGLALCVAAGRGPAARRAVVLVSVVLAGAALAVATVPKLAVEVAGGLSGWLLARDPWISQISEFQPVWSAPAGKLPGAMNRLGYLGLSLPILAIPGVAAAARGSTSRAGALAWFAVSGTLLAAWQVRFGRVVIPLLAAASALGLLWLCERARLPRRAAMALPLLALLAAAADPKVRTGVILPARPDLAIGAALDLQPPAEGERAPGVFAPWDMGHQVLVVSGRPVVATGFGSYVDRAGFEEVRRAWMLPEREVLAWMERRRLGFALAGAATFFGRVEGDGGTTPFTPLGGRLDLDYFQVVPLAAAIIGGSGVPETGIHHLERLMPRSASLVNFPGLAFPLPALWTFERVEGARIVGRAPPGARVVLEIDLAEWGRPHVWRAWADAGPDGSYQMIVPLPTGLSRPTLVTGTAGRLRARNFTVSLAIPEVAVRTGAVVAADVPAAGPTAAQTR